MTRPKPKIRYCNKNGKPCYDKRGATTVKNSRWKRDRVKLRIYQCCFDHWHVTKQLEPENKQRVKYDRNYKRKPKYKQKY